jgi:uncharacterized membrane protein
LNSAKDNGHEVQSTKIKAQSISCHSLMYAPPDQYIPQSISIRRPIVMWLIVAAGCLITMSLIIGAPLALETGHPFLGLTIYRAFSYVCHQIPERSFFIAEHQFAVCARCTGLYAGFATATLLYPLVRSLRQTEAPERKWLFIAAAPLAVDFTLGFFGVWDNTHFSRFATGALLGGAAVFYVIPGLVDLSLRDWHAVTGRAAGGKDATSESASVSATPRTPAEIFSSGPVAAPSDYSAPHRRI